MTQEPPKVTRDRRFIFSRGQAQALTISGRCSGADRDYVILDQVERAFWRELGPSQAGQVRIGDSRKAACQVAFSGPHGFLFPLRSLVSASGSQISNSPWSHDHTQSPQTAAHCHCHRCQSCRAGICGIRGTCGGSGSSRPPSWGYSHPRSQEHSQQGLGGSTVLGSSGGTWAMRGTWEGAGTAAGSAGRTSLQDFDLQQIKETL